MKLHEIIAEYASETTPNGGDEAPRRVLTKAERVDLERKLRGVGSRNDRLLVVVVLLLLVAFAASLVSGLANPSTEVVVGSMAGSGISTAALLFWAGTLWKSKGATEQLLTLAVALEGPALQTALDVLARQAVPPPQREET